MLDVINLDSCMNRLRCCVLVWCSEGDQEAICCVECAVISRTLTSNYLSIPPPPPPKNLAKNCSYVTL